ncbi:unnamed protein product [Urochloa humidicola]
MASPRSHSRSPSASTSPAPPAGQSGHRHPTTPPTHRSIASDLDCVDFSFTPSPERSIEAHGCVRGEESQGTKPRSFKEILLSPAPVRNLQEEKVPQPLPGQVSHPAHAGKALDGNPSTSVPVQQSAPHPSPQANKNKPKLRSVVVVPSADANKTASHAVHPTIHSRLRFPDELQVNLREGQAAEAPNHGWEEVRGRRRRRKETAGTGVLPRAQQGGIRNRLSWPMHGERRVPVHQRLGPRTTAASIPDLASIFKQRAAGRCFNCLASDHKIHQCRDPPKCILCLRFGHRARYCPSPPTTATTTRNSPPPPSSATHFPALSSTIPPQPSPSLLVAAMDGTEESAPLPRPGAPHVRPDRVEATAPVTKEMVHDLWNLLTYGVIAVATGPRPSRYRLAKALSVALHTNTTEMRISLYPPEGFLVVFSSACRRDAALRLRPDFKVDGTLIQFMPWTDMSHAAAAPNLRYKARLCIEGVPEHARHLDTVAKLVDPTTLMERLDLHTRTERDSACCCVWV